MSPFLSIYSRCLATRLAPRSPCRNHYRWRSRYGGGVGMVEEPPHLKILMAHFLRVFPPYVLLLRCFLNKITLRFQTLHGIIHNTFSHPQTTCFQASCDADDRGDPVGEHGPRSKLILSTLTVKDSISLSATYRAVPDHVQTSHNQWFSI